MKTIRSLMVVLALAVMTNAPSAETYRFDCSHCNAHIEKDGTVKAETYRTASHSCGTVGCASGGLALRRAECYGVRRRPARSHDPMPAEGGPLTPDDERRVLDFLGDSETHSASPRTEQTSLLAQLKPGTEVAGCRIERLLGQGGMGQVYLAEHLALRKKVAVKVLPAGVFSNPDLLGRFEREARLAARLDHPNVVRVLHAGVERGVHFILLDYVDGESLAHRIERDGRLPVDEALRVATQVAHGLAAAHALGIVHRDIKPGNILLARDGTARVADFGLARQAFSRSAITGTGDVLGTPYYMAPEQVESEPVDARTDLYGLGATLYCALTGRLPYRGDTAGAVLYEIVHKRPEPPSHFAQGVPPEVDEAVLRLLEKDPRRRFPSAGVLAEHLQTLSRFLAGGPRPSRPRRPEAAWAAVAFLGIVGGILLAWAPWRRSETPLPNPVQAPAPTPPPTDPRPPDVGPVVPPDVEPVDPPDTEPVVPPTPEPTVSWPSGWVSFFETRLEDMSERLPLAPGWVHSKGSLDAGPDVAPMRIPVPNDEFLAEIELELPDGEGGLEIGFGAESSKPGDSYRVRWRKGASLEWTRTSSGEVLLSRETPEGGAARHRVRVAWRAQGQLLVSIDDVEASATDPAPARFDEMWLSLAPVGGRLSVRSFGFSVPSLERRGPR